jgi:hypothetical protein
MAGVHPSMIRSRHVAIVAVSVAAAASAGWATVWRDRLPDPPRVPPIQIDSANDGSEGGQTDEDPERTDEKDGGGPSDASGTSVAGGERSGAAGGSVGGVDPASIPRPPAASDSDDDQDDDDP